MYVGVLDSVTVGMSVFVGVADSSTETVGESVAVGVDLETLVALASGVAVSVAIGVALGVLIGKSVAVGVVPSVIFVGSSMISSVGSIVAASVGSSVAIAVGSSVAASVGSSVATIVGCFSSVGFLVGVDLLVGVGFLVGSDSRSELAGDARITLFCAASAAACDNEIMPSEPSAIMPIMSLLKTLVICRPLNSDRWLSNSSLFTIAPKPPVSKNAVTSSNANKNRAVFIVHPHFDSMTFRQRLSLPLRAHS